MKRPTTTATTHVAAANMPPLRDMAMDAPLISLSMTAGASEMFMSDGDAVGAKLGILVGAIEGAIEPKSIARSPAVGMAVGIMVGAMVGEPVDMVGAMVGDMLGAPVGAPGRTASGKTGRGVR